ncbi:ABC transporter substrate-binding protein [Microbacterium abyssi]|uniref:ABC transporter substrate-binding protein n=1 Tax=Microbacterium abyssi TaxID=2782166 RepID=UPI001887C1A0|nr:extracellular solute-binding protein [Microbacterium sp. A18JL241]
MSGTSDRRGFWIAAATAAPLLALTACAPGGSTPPANDGEVGGEIRMLVNITDNLTQERWDELVAPFEDETGVDVKIEGPTGQSVAETFPALLAAGTAPDVIQSIFPTADTAPEVLDLTEYDWAAETPMADTYSTDGSINVVGVGTQAQSVLYYNKDLFAQAGITETPQTWDEFDDALAALADAGVERPIAFASEWATGVQAQQIWHPQQNVTTPEWQAAVSSGDSTLGEQFEPLFEHIQGWVDAGYTTADDVATDSGTQEANFIAGTTGIYPMGSWFTTTLAANPPAFEVGVFSPPVENAADYPGPMGATLAYPYMVWSGSSNVASATALVEYLVTDEDAIKLQAEMDGLSRPGMDTSTDEYSALVQGLVEEAPSLVVPGNQTVGDLALPVSGFNAKFTELVQGLWQGRASSEIADSLTAWYEAEKLN